jgi:two-component system, chemotaxis family, chemotaxis protein CheY
MSARIVKLLIVDDSSIIRARIARLAAHPRMGAIHIVGLARNGVEAVSLCRRTVPDVVTMDLTMPEMDGIACITELMRGHPSINILVVSALSDKTTAIEALKRGARGFINKPFSDEQLVDALLEVAE